MIPGIPEFEPRRRGQAMTNAQRQAAFRERHPDYYRQYRLKQRARVLAIRAELAAARQAARAAVREPLALPAPPVRLCLPLPAEQMPLFIRDERTPEPVPAAASRGEQPLARRAA